MSGLLLMRIVLSGLHIGCCKWFDVWEKCGMQLKFYLHLFVIYYFKKNNRGVKNDNQTNNSNTYNNKRRPILLVESVRQVESLAAKTVWL